MLVDIHFQKLVFFNSNLYLYNYDMQVLKYMGW